MGNFLGFNVSGTLVSKNKNDIQHNHFKFLPYLYTCVHFIVKLPYINALSRLYIEQKVLVRITFSVGSYLIILP